MTRFFIARKITVFEELWDHFISKIFLEEMPYYDNFELQSNELFSLRGLILGITVGIVIAALVTLYNKRYLGGFVRYLIMKDCVEIEKALKLDELDRKVGFGIRAAIKTEGSLRRWVHCAEEDLFYDAQEKARAEHEEKYRDAPRAPKFKEKTFKRNVKTMHFYVPEDKREEANAKFNPEGANLKGALIVVGIAVAFGLTLCYLLPEALVYVDGFMTLINAI